MRTNFFIKLLSSIPVILITLYFIPFLGICLILLRYFVYDSRKNFSTPIILLIFGAIIIFLQILNTLNSNILVIPQLKEFVKSNQYKINFIKYAKFLICIGIIFIALSFVFRKISNRLISAIKNYIYKTEKRNAEISRKNDMEIKIRQEKAKHTSFVRCPYCGGDNILTEKTGRCKFCRRELTNEKYE